MFVFHDAGKHKKSVNWDGRSHISDQNYLVRNALDCYCTGTNWCYVAAHSAGDLMMGYTLAMYGGSTRTVSNATPNASGVCGAAAGGVTQTGWSGSSGGSYCNPSDWFCNDLTMGTAANEGGTAKWAWHSVKFRHDNEQYDHYTNGQWQGTVGLVRQDMVTNAN